jgi:transposase
VITVGMLATIRRMHLRDKLSIREISRRTNLSRNTIRQWLRQPNMVEPKYSQRPVISVVEPYFEQIRQWLKADSHRGKKEHHTASRS